MTEFVQLPMVEENRFQTSRKDAWWIMPLIQGGYLVLFGIYAMWAVAIDFRNYDFFIGDTHFISPFFNPDIKIPGWPEWLSPGLILIWAPLGFRATCYYARKVYYRAFFWDPPACAISEAKANHGEYKGESKLPYIVNNLHRYFFGVAFILAFFHIYEVFRLLFTGGFNTLAGGMGTIIIAIDATFLSLYVLSCHSCKHVVGGSVNRPMRSMINYIRYRGWKIVKRLNINHNVYFWASLTSILISDLYIRFVLPLVVG